jgi:hypothetical protein
VGFGAGGCASEENEGFGEEDEEGMDLRGAWKRRLLIVLPSFLSFGSLQWSVMVDFRHTVFWNHPVHRTWYGLDSAMR